MIKILVCYGYYLFRASLKRQFKKAILIDARARDGDLALFMEHIGNTSGRAKVAIIFDEDAANFRGCAVLIVGRSFDNYRYTTRRITLVNNFIETRGFVSFAGSPFNRPVDV